MLFDKGEDFRLETQQGEDFRLQTQERISIAEERLLKKRSRSLHLHRNAE